MFGLEKKPFAVELHSNVVESTCVVDLEAHPEVTSLQRSSLEHSPCRKSLIIVAVAWKAIFAFVDSGHRNRLPLNPDRIFTSAYGNCCRRFKGSKIRNSNFDCARCRRAVRRS
uniref:(northern house mosquito) hypothetical protein n=1 Tax=Culex pipiens TaxID=7175 RepID=A0A8D8JPR5_CULPI